MNAVFAQVSFQFCGHLDEYLIRRADHVALFYMQTRFGKGGHCLKVYERGVLVGERRFSSHASIPGYYFLWVWHWSVQLLKFARKHKKVTAIFTHPLGAFGMSARKRVQHVFWQWDYFPDRSLVSRLFNGVAKYYAKRCTKYFPLTNAIGSVMGAPDAPALMLGVQKPVRYGDLSSRKLLLVGQLRHGQGIEEVLDFIKNEKMYSLSLVGAAAAGFEDVINEIIAKYGIADRVTFPNKFVTDEALRAEAAGCFASLAIYDTSSDNLTHFADPGKVKSSVELGLPVVMTRISEIVPYVERFHAGVVVESFADIKNALSDIAEHYESYCAGVEAFAKYFQYDRYYDNGRLLGE
jgi:hypothetical protein